IFCRVLHAVHRYCSTCNYFWMFCEGFYLHRLLIQAFRVPKNLTWYYITGWGGSLIPILVYVIVRLTTADYERGLKATFLLVPLFGIQLFFITYRPPVEKANRLLYEIVSKVIIDSQGSLVSLIFFYMNAEVHTALKYQLRIIHLQFPYKTKKSISRNQSATQMSSIRQTSQRNGCYDGPKFEKTVHINGDAKEYVFS
ncbi:Hypothetical predicted protein, partial [Mytilus galloprovincialis]